MASVTREKSVIEAQHKIFNKLCAAYRQSHQNPAFRLRAEDVRNELDLSREVFREALEGFADPNGERIVVVFEQNGDRFISLGETAKSNLSDWRSA
ncbi:MAG TPA: hypothetical protein VFV34_04920 [Blastocatellia bacterium]|nr:hypothetical protein [Blastocatellia bacterium]